MIFVTVGTSDFDPLVEKIDRLAPSLADQVIVQIGSGKYIPMNCQYFRFAPSLETYYDKADIVVAHGGLGTTMEVLRYGKKLISVKNITLIDDQTDILEVMANEDYLVWCRDLEDLPRLLGVISEKELKRYAPPTCKIAEKIKDFLKNLE